MATGDRNKKGKATDIVRHFSLIGDSKQPICETKGYGYSTTDKYEVSCKKCLQKLIKTETMTDQEKQQMTNEIIAKLLGCEITEIANAWMDDETEIKAMLVDEFKVKCKSYIDDAPIEKIDLPGRANQWETLDLHEFRGIKLVYSTAHLDTLFYNKTFEQNLLDSVNVEETNERWTVGKANFHIVMTASIRNENDNNFFEKIGDKIAIKFIATELDKDIIIVNEASGKLNGDLEYRIIITRADASIIYIETLGYFRLENDKING